jgi:thiamine-phosphate pyrophosphorylase
MNRPIVCYVTDRGAFGATDSIACLLERVRAVAAAGVDWVQIREKDLTGRELLGLARKAVDATNNLGRGGQARVMINDRLDVALASRAAGVHLGGGSVPATEVVRWCRGGNAPAEFLVGVSCHTIAGAREAESAGASYVFFGPIFDTPSKRPFGLPQGTARLAEVCHAIRIPVIAIGGVNEENGAECIRAWAAGIAAVRLFQEPRDANTLKDAVARLHNLARTITSSS